MGGDVLDFNRRSSRFRRIDLRRYDGSRTRDSDAAPVRAGTPARFTFCHAAPLLPGAVQVPARCPDESRGPIFRLAKRGPER